MIRWMCGVSMKDRRTSEEWRKLVGVEPITTVIRSGRLSWYGHVMRKSDEDWAKKCMEYRVEGRRLEGRPRRTWLESVEAELEIDREDGSSTKGNEGDNLHQALSNRVTTASKQQERHTPGTSHLICQYSNRQHEG